MSNSFPITVEQQLATGSITGNAPPAKGDAPQLIRWLREQIRQTARAEAMEDVINPGANVPPFEDTMGTAFALAAHHKLSRELVQPAFEAEWNQAREQARMATLGAEKATRRLAYERAHGSKILEEARAALQQAGFHVHDDILIPYLRRIALATVPSGRGAKR